MKYEFKTKEAFVMHAIFGCDSVDGLGNPFSNMPKARVQKEIDKIIKDLIARNIVVELNGTRKLNGEFELLIATISNPTINFMIADGDGDPTEFIYIGSDSFIFMKADNDTLHFESFDSRVDMEIYLCNHLMFLEKDDGVQCMISVTSDIIDRTLEMVKSGNIGMALKMLNVDDFDQNQMKSMLMTIVNPEQTMTIIGIKSYELMKREAVIRIFKAGNDCWIVKHRTSDLCKNTMILKAIKNNIIKVLFNF